MKPPAKYRPRVLVESQPNPHRVKARNERAAASRTWRKRQRRADARAIDESRSAEDQCSVSPSDS